MTTTLTPYTLICGMEVHAELKTQSKMFCGCQNDPFHAPAPNTYTCPVCLGMPGGLPVPNAKAIEWTIKLGLALGCQVNLFSHFDRKNYFYPDLPKGYQISQYDQPFCVNGKIETPEGPVRIHRIHLEEDTGKLQHKTIHGRKVSLIDFNRGGVPLIEIVTEPDIHTPSHAKAYTKALRQVLRYLDIADCDMEQGGMRLEANISLQRPGETKLPNYKVELKNINSFRFLEKAIAYEIKRHAKLLDAGETPLQETRGWRDDKGETFSQRTKESAEDYRYFPDPDIPPLRFTQEQIESWRSELPELPWQRAVRWSKDFGIESKYADILLEEPDAATWTERVFVAAQQAKIPANQVANALVNKKVAYTQGDDPGVVVQAVQALSQADTVSEDELIKAIKSVLSTNPDAVSQYKAGKTQVVGFFLGQVMKSLGKKLDPKEVTRIVSTQLHST